MEENNIKSIIQQLFVKQLPNTQAHFIIFSTRIDLNPLLSFNDYRQSPTNAYKRENGLIFKSLIGAVLRCAFSHSKTNGRAGISSRI